MVTKQIICTSIPNTEKNKKTIHSQKKHHSLQTKHVLSWQYHTTLIGKNFSSEIIRENASPLLHYPRLSGSSLAITSGGLSNYLLVEWPKRDTLLPAKFVWAAAKQYSGMVQQPKANYGEHNTEFSGALTEWMALSWFSICWDRCHRVPVTREVDGPVSNGRCSEGKTDGIWRSSVKYVHFSLLKKNSMNPSQQNSNDYRNKSEQKLWSPLLYCHIKKYKFLKIANEPLKTKNFVLVLYLFKSNVISVIPLTDVAQMRDAK